MRLFEALFTYLSAIPAVTNLIGAGTSCKLRELFIERGDALPYVSLSVEDVERFHQFGGYPSASHAEVSIDCFAHTAPSAAALSEVIYAALVRQEVAIMTATGLTVCGVLFDSRSQEYLWNEETDVKLFSDLLKFKIVYSI